MNPLERRLPEISALASAQANELFALRCAGHEAEALRLREEQLRNFQQTYQPALSGKEYTALFRTYNDRFDTALRNLFVPGSAVSAPAVSADSIGDGDEIYRPGTEMSDPGKWRSFLAQAEGRAERAAKEIAALAASGGDTDARMKEQQLAAAKIAIEHGLTDVQFKEHAAIYKAKFLQTLKVETAARQAKLNGPDDAQCKAMVEEMYRAFLPLAFAGDAENSRPIIMAFEDKVQAIARELPAPGRQGFLDRMERQREGIAKEYQRDRDGLRRRLGLDAGPVAFGSTSHSSAQQLGDLAVRTAVRATVWETIRSIFRSFR